MLLRAGALAFCIALFLTFGATSIDSQSATGGIGLVGGRVITSPDAEPRIESVRIGSNGRIVTIADRIAYPGDMRIIDCAGLVLVAGFQNSHVHFTEDKWADAAQQPAARLNEQLRDMLIRYGFTTVVDTASLLPNTLALRRRIENGEVAGPRILTAGLALYPPDGVPYYVKEGVPPGLLSILPQPLSAAEARRAVQSGVDGGADIVKLFTGSWITRNQAKPMPIDIATAAVQEAHRRNRLVFTHPSNVAGLEVAIAADADVLAHAVEDTRGLTDAHLERMKASDLALIPTLSLFAGDNDPAIAAQARRYLTLGGQVLFGTDVGYVADYDPRQEYQLMSAAGLTWRQILATLTTAPAARFNEGGRRGRLAPGFEGDVVALGSDPRIDPRAFADVRFVIRAGRVIFVR